MTDIYLDHHTTSCLDPAVKDVMLPYLDKKFGNYLQPHSKGQELVVDLQNAFQSLYQLIGADAQSDTIIFTSSCEEAISHAYQIALKNKVQQEGKNHFLTLQSEDAAILMNLEKLKSFGCHVHMLEQLQEGILDEEKIIEAINPRTAMVSLSLASGLTGLIQPIEKLKEVCKMRGIYLHLDITYALGKIEINAQDLAVDFLTFGGDQLHGPKSSGGIYVRSQIALSPLIGGGLEQNGLRGGIVDACQLMGLAHAAKLSQDNISEMCLEVASQRDLLERCLQEGLDDIEILFDKNLRLPNVAVISFKNVVADALLYELNAHRVYATLGGVNFQKLSTLLESLQMPPLIANGALSFALSRYTSAEEIKRASEVIIQAVCKLRKLSKQMKVSDAT